MATTRALEDREIQVMFAQLCGRHAVRNRAMLTVGIHLALRASEICGLSVGDVYDGRAVRNYVTIRAAIAKGKRSRIIRIGDEIKGAIADYIAWKQKAIQSMAPDAPLFVSQKGGHLSRKRLFAIVKEVMTLAGISQSPHALRKTGATLYYEQSGSDLIATQEFLGHADPSVTRRYIGITARQRAKYARRASQALWSAIEGKSASHGEAEKAKRDLTDERSRFASDQRGRQKTEIERQNLIILRLTRQNGQLLDLLAQACVDLPFAVNDSKVIPINAHIRAAKGSNG